MPLQWGKNKTRDRYDGLDGDEIILQIFFKRQKQIDRSWAGLAVNNNSKEV